MYLVFSNQNIADSIQIRLALLHRLFMNLDRKTLHIIDFYFIISFGIFSEIYFYQMHTSKQINNANFSYFPNLYIMTTTIMKSI